MSISVRGVTKLYGEQKALDDISFQINTGEIVGFLGPNGAGKTTLMRIITGFIPASHGSVLVHGIDSASDNISIRRRIGYLPENNPLYPEMYVREYLGFVASLYRMSKPVKKRIDDIIGITGLSPEQGKKIGSLSKGYRQRVGLAQALIHDPDVLILDEATSGLDPNQIVEIRDLISNAGREKTIMLSTHIMQEVETICRRIIIIDKGKIVADELKSNIHSVIKRRRQVIHVEFDNSTTPLALKGIPKIVSVSNKYGNSWQVEAESEEDIRPALFAFAVKNNLTVLSLHKEESSLEEVFRHLTTG
jgi:ABC-2 type transport system ATP-binding protein